MYITFNVRVSVFPANDADDPAADTLLL